MLRILPVLSLCLLASAVPAAELPADVQRALDVRKVPHDAVSILVEDLEAGEIVLDWNGDKPRNPASTIKLVTTLVALDVLGPAYRWRTDVYALGDLAAGKLTGDLLIRGGGDPFLVTERVWQLLRRVRQAGIDDIDGDIVIDDSYFLVEDHDPASFDRQPLRAYNVAPNALLMNFKVVRYWFEPEPETGSVRIWLDPALANIDIDNRLSLSPGRCRGYQRGIAISANETLDRMTFSGRFPTGCERYAMDRTALSANEFAFGLVSALWQESGGRIAGGWRNEVVPEDVEPIVSFDSVPLMAVIERINKHSNNVMARHLLYTLAAEVLGAPGTEAGGRQVVADWLRQRELDSATLELDNGAGLSREARIAARDLNRLLAWAWRQPYMPEYVASLALAGRDGTLRNRFEDRALHGKAHLKTGSLDDVTGIAGYLQSRSGRRFAVTMLANHPDVHRGPGEEAQEALLRWLYRQ